MSEEINQARRRFLGVAAMSIAAVDARKFIFQVKSLTWLSPSLPPWHLRQTLDPIHSAGGKA